MWCGSMDLESSRSPEKSRADYSVCIIKKNTDGTPRYPSCVHSNIDSLGELSFFFSKDSLGELSLDMFMILA